MPVYLRMDNPYIIEKDADRTKWAKAYSAGEYDGIIDLKNNTYYVEGQSQIKSATDNIGTFSKGNKDIRFSMEEIDPAKMGEPTLPRTAGTMSVGQYKKRIADLTKAKSYSKDQIYDIVKKLPMADMAMEKTREQVAEAVWQIYNEQLTASERREAAHDIALKI